MACLAVFHLPLIPRLPALVLECKQKVTALLNCYLFIFSQEIIQNADDAGATKVYFLLDSRPGFYGRDSLYDASLAKFQGPALYAQNDALFKESDWENLQRPMQSNKKNDPLKVGRFGIGFNSVYHMTG